MTERLECALDHVEDYLRSVKAVSSRDIREPGRKQKHKAESRLQAIVTRHFRKQRAAIVARLEAFPPQQKALYQYNLDDLLGDDEWLASVTRLLLQFVVDGIELSAPTMGITIDYTLANASAAKWARKYAATLVKDIDATTEKVIRETIGDYIDTQGMTMRDVIDRVNAVLDNPVRAELVAQSEVSRAYAQGNIETGKAWQKEFPDIPVVKTWHTNHDTYYEGSTRRGVCAVCESLDRLEVLLDEPFHSSVTGEDYNAPGDPHPGDRCWIVVSPKLTKENLG